MSQHNESIEAWNKFALLYEAKFMDLDLYNESYDFLCTTLIKDKAKILEIACGPGNITKYLSHKRPDYTIFGIDTAAAMIELAGKNCPSANFELMDAREISQLNSSFDAIICGFCLPYLSNQETEKLISDSYQLLNEGGLFYLSFVEGDPGNSGFQTNGNGERICFYYHNKDRIQEHLKNNKFTELLFQKVRYKKSETEIDFHTIIIAQKMIG